MDCIWVSVMPSVFAAPTLFRMVPKDQPFSPPAQFAARWYSTFQSSQQPNGVDASARAILSAGRPICARPTGLLAYIITCRFGPYDIGNGTQAALSSTTPL